MLFGDVIAIALSIFGFLLSLQGLWLLCRALWPGRVSAATVRCERNAVACFLVGLVATALFALVAAMIGRLGTFGQLSAFALGLVYIMYAGIGSAGLVTHIGQRLASPTIDAQRPWRATVRGGVALELACLIPVLGWLGILPISLILGAGATTLAMFKRRESATAPFVRPPLPRDTTIDAAMTPDHRYASPPSLPIPPLETDDAVGAAS